PVATNELLTRPLFALDSGRIQKLTPARSGLQMQAGASGRLSFTLNENFRASFESVARSAALDVIFDRDFRGDWPLSLKLDNVGVLDALDALAFQTRSFWVVLDSKTIMAIPENQ